MLRFHWFIEASIFILFLSAMIAEQTYQQNWVYSLDYTANCDDKKQTLHFFGTVYIDKATREQSKTPK